MVKRQKGKREERNSSVEKSYYSCSVNTFVVLYRQETSENEIDELSNHSCHSGKQYHLKPACILNSFMFL